MNPTPTPSSTAPVDIARLRELLAKATPGPWKSLDDPDGLHQLWTDRSFTLDQLIARSCFKPASKQNTDLIAALRNEAPALLDELERLRHQLKKPRSCDTDEINQLKAERDKLREEVERLDGELESHSFSLSPAMVQARNDQLNEEVSSLRQENERLLKEIEGLKANQKESQ